jgi:hypothetical protein
MLLAFVFFGAYNEGGIDSGKLKEDEHKLKPSHLSPLS